MSSIDVVEDFCSSLCDLTVNSKPHINMLTMLAEDYIADAPAIVQAVEDQLKHVSSGVKLPLLYLIDSIVKNVGKSYITLFSKNLVATFTHAFENVDERARSQMYKLRQTWTVVFPPNKLFALDTKVNAIDPAWPITAAPTPGSIHVNPKFLQTPQQLGNLGDKRQELFQQQQELLELERKKLELELMQTKVMLEKQKILAKQAPTTDAARVAPVKDVARIPPVKDVVRIPPVKDVIRIPPATNILSAAPSPAAMVAPIRIRDPRLRMKEAEKPATPPESPISPRAVLSPVPSPSNSQQSSSETKSKKDKKKKKESRSPRKSEESSPAKPKEKSEKVKLTPAEEVLKNLEEEQRLSKIQKLGSDTVIKKAKQHEQKLQPKAKETFKEDSSKKSDAKAPPSKRAEKTASPPKKAEKSPKRVESPKQSDKSPKRVEQRLPSPKSVEPKAPSPKSIERSPKRVQRSPKRVERSPKLTEPKKMESKEPPKDIEPKSPKQTSPKLLEPQEEPKSKGESPEPPPPPIISALPRSPLSSSLSEVRTSSPMRTPPPPPIIDSPLSTASSKEKSTPECSPRKSRRLRKTKSKSPTPPPIRIKKPRERFKKNSKRKRDTSISPEHSPKRKTPTRTKSPPPPVEKEPAQTVILEAETLLDSGHDTDLRLLTAKNMELNSPSKKGPGEALDELFGKEDVDLRALPPPPPIISRPTPPGSPSEPPPTPSPERSKSKSWANLKRSNSEISPEVSKRHKPDRRKSDRFNNDKDSEKDEEPSFDDPAYEERVKERAENIMKHAEEQLSNGNITFAQYNNLLKEVITMNEKRKLEEAMKRDLDAEFEFDKSKSPSPEPRTEEPLNEYTKRRRREQERKDREKDREKDRFEDVLPPPPPPELNERDFLREDRDRRYEDRRSRYDNRLPPKGTWMPSQMPPMRPGMRGPRDKYGRWPPMPPGPPGPTFGPRFGPPGPPMNFPMPPGQRELPPADPSVLEMIAKDSMKTINIDGVPREIRFYGETAIIIMGWDDPRELSFQPDTRRVTFNDRETFLLNFNAPYKEICVDGFICKVRLGAPTRELYVDGNFYEGIFGGQPIKVRIGNNWHSVRLHGPLPNVRIGNKPRTDLVAGKVSLVVDANDIFTIYLDAKPQRIDISGIPYILRFVEALQTLVINGVPFKVEFGSNLPVPMYFHGEKHYLRFSALPKGVRPGYISIVNMEGGRLPSPPPMKPPPMPMMMPAEPMMPPEVLHGADMPPIPPKMEPPAVLRPPDQPLELLASLMPSFTPGIGQSYTVEDAQPETLPPPAKDVGPINVGELLKKLQAVGIVPTLDKKEEKKEDVSTEIIPVSFDNHETLRTKQPGLIHLLYSGMQCSSCGVRFPPEQTGKYSQHLDWHFRQNRRERDAMRIAQSRRWNYDVSDWIQYQEIEEKEDRAQSWFEIQEKRNFETEESTEDEQSVPAGDKGEEACCDLCQDKFDQFYNEEKEEWHLRRAIEVDGKLYHPMCHKEKEEKASAPPPPMPLLLPTTTGEPELIEIPDDVTTGDEPVLKMPGDDEKVECIDLDSEPSSSRDAPEQKKEEEEEEEEPESDDDILGVEVLERKIETYDLVDEEDDEQKINDVDDEQTIELEMPQAAEQSEEDLEVDLSRVKSEKVEVVDLDAQTSQPTVVSTIDGNVDLEDAAPVSLPKRIVINIPSAVTRQPPPPPEEPADAEAPAADELPPPTASAQPIDPSEPPPPGEELYPHFVKPKIADVELKVLQPVHKGSELSALCSIM